MRSLRGPSRPLLAAASLTTALALALTACGSETPDPDPKPAAEGQGSAEAQEGGKESGDRAQAAKDLADRLKKHGIDAERWKDGAWKDWDKDDWLREAKDFVNPVIQGLWKPERMRGAEDPGKTVTTKDTTADQGQTDPAPRAVPAEREQTPYHDHAAPVGKVFFDAPAGSMVCSATVVKDPRNPGKSNLVWTAGHCVHAGAEGGWYRNIAFVPSYNDLGKDAAGLAAAAPHESAPYGTWWADWAATSNEWIGQGAGSGGAGAPYDYAVLHVKPESGAKSLEETVGNALEVDFRAPGTERIGTLGAWGYPAGPPYDGLLMHRCADRPGRLSLASGQPTMYRIGCTMTGGSSGGGWFRQEGKKSLLVSNTSIGPADNTWLAGPQLGRQAERLFDMMSQKYGGS
ncbi:trypsin-like serine peptidase [Streptomyces albidoflavus]|uniref:trypsin-like serine peptidase n=1 Tax=Streptomyces albidoflavus TaxID=1886 RepID=UPI004040FC4E